jgi:hypothetical protein
MGAKRNFLRAAWRCCVRAEILAERGQNWFNPVDSRALRWLETRVRKINQKNPKKDLTFV